MEITIIYDNVKETKEIDTVDHLKDELLEFAGFFIPEAAPDAVELLNQGFYDDLIEELEEYFVKDFFLIAKKFFLEIKKIYSMSTMDEITGEFDTLNEIFKEAGFNVEYNVE